MAWSRYPPREVSLRDTGLACVGAGEKKYPPDQGISGRRLPCHGMVVVSKGSGAFSDPSGDCAVTAPAVLWLFPGVAHSYRSTGTGWTEHWICSRG